MFGMDKYYFLGFNQNDCIKKYMIKYISKFIESNGIPIKIVSREEIAESEGLKESTAGGLYIYYKDNRKSYQIPRIEILDEYSDHFQLYLHEFGHHIIQMNNEEQTEEKADQYVLEFFNKYLPKFFSWIYQIELNIRTGIELNFTKEENKKYRRQANYLVKYVL